MLYPFKLQTLNLNKAADTHPDKNGEWPTFYLCSHWRQMLHWINLLPLQGLWEDMGLQKKHWMVTLQEVFYPALAAVGLPCKYRINVSAELLVERKPKFFHGIKNPNYYRYLLILVSFSQPTSLPFWSFWGETACCPSRVPSTWWQFLWPTTLSWSSSWSLSFLSSTINGSPFGVTSRGATWGTYLPTEHTMPQRGWWLCSRCNVL